MTRRLEPAWTPGEPLPTRAHRATLAVIMSDHFGVSFTPRSFERWPLKKRTVNGVATYCVKEAIAVAERRYCAEVMQSSPAATHRRQERFQPKGRAEEGAKP